MLLTCTSPLIAIALQKGTSIVYPILWRRQIQLCLNTVRRVDCHLSQESSPTSSPWLATLGRDNVKPNNRSKTQEQPTQPASTQTAPPQKPRNSFFFPHITVGFLFSCLHPAGRRPPSSAAVRRRALSHTHHKTYLIIHKSCHIIHNSSHITHHSSHTQLISHNTHLTHTHITKLISYLSHTISYTTHLTHLISYITSHTTHLTHTHITKLIIHTPHLIHHITHHSSHTHTSQNLSHHTQVISHHTQLIPHTTHLTHNSSHRQCVAGAVRRAA